MNADGQGYTHVGGRSILSTCTDDVVLEPLGPFIFVAFTLVLLPLAVRFRSTSYMEGERDEMLEAQRC